MKTAKIKGNRVTYSKFITINNYDLIFENLGCKFLGPLEYNTMLREWFKIRKCYIGLYDTDNTVDLQQLWF